MVDRIADDFCPEDVVAATVIRGGNRDVMVKCPELGCIEYCIQHTGGRILQMGEQILIRPTSQRRAELLNA